MDGHGDLWRISHQSTCDELPCFLFVFLGNLITLEYHLSPFYMVLLLWSLLAVQQSIS